MANNLVESFYFLFKSNAKQEAADTLALSKAQDDMEKKASDNAEKRTRSTKKAQQATKDLTEEQKKQKEQTEELAKQFTKIVESLTEAATAYLSFGAIKSGLLNAQGVNVALGRTANLTKQNAKDIAVYGAALEQFGGDSAGFQDTLRNMTQLAAQQGRQLPPLLGFFKDLNRELQGLSSQQSLFRLHLLGIDDPAMIQLLRSAPEDYDKIISRKQQLIGVNEEDIQKQTELTKAWNDTKDAVEGVFTKIETYLTPALIGLNKLITSIAVGVRDHPFLSLTGMVAIGAGLTYLSGVIVATLIPAFAALVTAAAPILIVGAALAGLTLAAGWIYNKVTGGSGEVPQQRSPGTLGGNKDAISFYKSNGLSDAVAAALAGQEISESSGNPHAYNQGHYGLYQWSEARRNKIIQGTGIDVKNATDVEQRMAALWELQKTGLDKQLEQTKSAAEASDLLTRKFEIPASGAALDAEAAKRAVLATQIAINSANSSGLNGSGALIQNIGSDRSLSLKIDEVNVNTQATDAKGVAADFHQALSSHIQTAVSNYDDGVAK